MADTDWEELCGAGQEPFEIYRIVGKFERRLMLFPERAAADLAPVNAVA